MRIFAFAIALAIMASTAAAETPDWDEPTKLFASHCIANYITPGYDVQKDLSERPGVLRLSHEQAMPFLDNQSGSAWTFKTAKSQYVVAVTTNTGCHFYALQGDRDRAWTDFDSMAASMFKPWDPIEFYPTSLGRNTDTQRNFKSIYYNAPQKAPTPAFLLTTDYSDKPNSFAIRLRAVFLEKGLLDYMKERGKQSATASDRSGEK